MVHILAVSDQVDESLWHDVGPFGGVNLILACGDLPFDYLAHLMQVLDVPLVFVPGNHDPDVAGYRQGRRGLVLRAGMPSEPPWPSGAINADGRVVDAAGLRLAGLGGCLRYSDGPNQYSQRQQTWRARKLAAAVRWRQLRDGRSVDVLLTHAAPRGVGDGEDAAHQGFTALNHLVARIDPTLLLHGHVQPEAGAHREHALGRTIVRNVFGRQAFDIEPTRSLGRSVGRHAS
jgi:Calcineurin-like phosphoesterase